MRSVFLDVNLHAGEPHSAPVYADYGKVPVDLIAGDHYGDRKTRIDFADTPQMEELSDEASRLQSIPEINRLRPLISLLRSTLRYPFPEAFAELENSDPVRADFVKSQILPGGSASWLSEVVANGYGICSHMSATYLWLAERAGLKGVLLTNPGTITNIVAAETGDPIFKMTPLDKTAPAHAWTEIYTDSHGWIPVDPTTRLVGDRPEYFETFTDAGYRAVLPLTELATVTPDDAVTPKMSGALLEAGEDLITIRAQAGLHEPRFNFSTRNYTQPVHAEYRGPARLTFHDYLGEVGLMFLGASKV